MGRIKGKPNKRVAIQPETLVVSEADRLHFLTNLIVDQILEAQRSDYRLLDELRIGSHDEAIAC